MTDLVLHAVTQQQLDNYLLRPSHALLLSGSEGIGKLSIAQKLAANLLAVSQEALEKQPYVRQVGTSDSSTISIDEIRAIGHFLARKVPGAGKRVVIINGADKLTAEAQNALLKTLEEPPSETYLLLTAASDQTLLPTIRSRATKLAVARPSIEQLTQHFNNQGFNDAQVQQANLMSGGLPGIMHALLHEETDHPLFAAVAVARELVRASTFERLAFVDSLAKDKEQCLRVLSVLQQMAHVALLQGRSIASWQRVLTASYQATKQLLGSGQPKLVLTNLMLGL